MDKKSKFLGPVALFKELRGTVKIVTWPTVADVLRRFITVATVSIVSALLVFLFDLALGRLLTLVM